MNATSATPPMTLEQIASCVSGYDPNALPVAQAREFIARLVPTVIGIEAVAIRSALGRVLARDVISPIAVPAADNSAMDGYALRGADLSADAPTRLRVVGKGFAVDAVGASIGAGECVRIITAPVMMRTHSPAR